MNTLKKDYINLEMKKSLRNIRSNMLPQDVSNIDCVKTRIAMKNVKFFNSQNELSALDLVI